MVGHQERSTMAELRWIMMSSFLMLVFNSKAATGGYSSITVRDGDEVTLPCELEHINDCSNVIWLFSSSGKTTTLYEYGKIHKDLRDKSKRLSVTEKCSLVIKNIMMVDVGRYTCRYFGSGNIPDTVLDLNVVTTATTPTPTPTPTSTSTSIPTPTPTPTSTSTSIPTPTPTPTSTSIPTPTPTPTSTSTSIPTPTPTPTSTSTSIPTPTPKSKTSEVSSPHYSVLGYFMLGLHVAEVLLMTVISVLLARAAWNQRSPRHNTVKEDENEDVVNYENAEDPHVSVRLH